jgi:hypothetical protein
LTSTDKNESTLCKTCGLAKRLLEPSNGNSLTAEPSSSIVPAIIDGALAGAVATASWIILASLTPWLPSFLWCFIIGGLISFAMRVKMPSSRPDVLAVGIGLIGSIYALVGVYGVRFTYINEMQRARGLTELPLWPGRETFIQVLTAGETSIGIAQLVVLFIAVAAGGITAGVVAD